MADGSDASLDLADNEGIDASACGDGGSDANQIQDDSDSRKCVDSGSGDGDGAGAEMDRASGVTHSKDENVTKVSRENVEDDDDDDDDDDAGASGSGSEAHTASTDLVLEKDEETDEKEKDAEEEEPAADKAELSERTLQNVQEASEVSERTEDGDSLSVCSQDASLVAERIVCDVLAKVLQTDSEDCSELDQENPAGAVHTDAADVAAEPSSDSDSKRPEVGAHSGSDWQLVEQEQDIAQCSPSDGAEQTDNAAVPGDARRDSSDEDGDVPVASDVNLERSGPDEGGVEAQATEVEGESLTHQQKEQSSYFGAALRPEGWHYDTTRTSSGKQRPQQGNGRGERRGDSTAASGDENRNSSADLSATMTRSTEGSASFASSDTIPDFKTLQDQQVSWLSMYHLLENRHRGELQQQHAEHERLIIDAEQRLRDESPSSQQEMSRGDAECPSTRRGREDMVGHSSHKRVSGFDDEDALSSSTYQLDREEVDRVTHGWTNRAKYSHRLPNASWSSQRDGADDRYLRGGVYSSPMPFGRTKVTERRSLESEVGSRQWDVDPVSRNQSYQQSSQLISPEESLAVRKSALQQEPLLSPRTRLHLHEKHAKHVADLRSYYESEIEDLRQKLNTSWHEPALLSSVAAGRDAPSASYSFQKENQSLKSQLRELQDRLDDSHIYCRELEQKKQGLEIRAMDYEQRYRDSESSNLKLKNLVEELRCQAQDREAVLEQVRSSEQRASVALQALTKAQEEQGETSRREQMALKRLLDKYESLERDYDALKDISTDFEQKLFDSRSETVQLNKIISKLELDLRRLTHENESIQNQLDFDERTPYARDRAPNQSPSGAMMTRYQANDAPVDSWSSSVADRYKANGTSQEMSPSSLARDKSEDTREAEDYVSSPLLKAERELRRLQRTIDDGNFSSRSHARAGGPGAEVKVIDTIPTQFEVPNDAARPGSRRVERSPLSPAKGSWSGSGSGRSTVPHPRGSVGSALPRSSAAPRATWQKKEMSAERHNVRKVVDSLLGWKPSVSNESAANLKVDAALQHVRSGDVISRPKWEDVYTSLTTSSQTDNKYSAPGLNMTQEEMLRNRVQSIDQMETRYDSLQVEKRKLESQLNKIPSHGRDRKGRQEKEQLETRLDNVDHELGSLRMVLKRYHVLKTSM